jgi:hypothetical protein
MLCDTELTPRVLSPYNDRELPKYGIGLTDLMQESTHGGKAEAPPHPAQILGRTTPIAQAYWLKPATFFDGLVTQIAFENRLSAADIRQAPPGRRRNLPFVSDHGLVTEDAPGGWWWTQSGANPSPVISLLNREITGNFS